MENKKVKNTKKGEDAVIRHCAYCLQLCGFPVKLCRGCKKKAYCSKECQAKDWSVKGDGQRHVNWCRSHECGEEDVDWEVVPIPNKGLGIRAKKLLPAGMKIIVEPVFTSPDDHPGIQDLGPEDGTLEEKFKSNTVGGRIHGGVALRIARVNHSCQPNVSYICEEHESARVAVLYALKDIQSGEEVTRCYYYPFFRLSSAIHTPCSTPEWTIEEELNFVKNKLFHMPTLGIVCPADCPCFDPTILALVQEGGQLHATVTTFDSQLKIEEALEAGDKLLNVHRRLNISWLYLGITMFDLFQIAVQKSEFLPRAMNYLRSAAELFHKICPYSEKYTKRVEMLLEHPETDPNYMLIDKMQGVSDSI